MRNDQLNRSLIQETKSDRHSLRPIAAGIAFLLSFSVARSQNITEKPMHILKTNAVSFLDHGTSGSNYPGFINGSVQDSISNEPVNGVSIVIRNTSFSCTTDSTGSFFLELPASFDADSIQLDLSYDGYASKSITLSAYAPMYAMLDPVTIGGNREPVTVGALIRTPFHEISVRKFRFSRLLHPFRRFRKKKHLS